MVKESVDFSISRAKLCLRIGENGWCKVFYQGEEGEVTMLGSESAEHILAKLGSFLRKPQVLESCGEIDDKRVAWIMSLSELHGTLYFSSLENGVRIHIQGKDGENIASMDLSKSDIDAWLSVIEDR